MEKKNINNIENERKQRPCPVCLEMIDETAEICPYCDEPTCFKHAHTNDAVATPTAEYELDREGMSLWKKVLIGVACICAALFIIGLFLPDDENDITNNDTIITENDTIVSYNQKNIILKGVIGEKIGFSMNLQQNGDEIEGTEHYDNQKSDVIVSIKGTIDDEGYMTLYEYDDGVRTGSFGGIIDGSSYYGTFTNAKGNKMPFSADVFFQEDTENQLEGLGKEEIDESYLISINELISILDLVNEESEDEGVSPEVETKVNEILIEEHQFIRGENDWVRQVGEVWVFNNEYINNENKIINPLKACAVSLYLEYDAHTYAAISVYSRELINRYKEQAASIAINHTSPDSYKTSQYDIQFQEYDNEYQVIIYKQWKD